jgi:hypothetical protein
LNNGGHTLSGIARDAAGNTAVSTIIVTINNPSPPPPDTTPPSTPTGLHSTANSSSSISLAWNAAADNPGGSGISNYGIYRNSSLIAIVDVASGLNYIDDDYGAGLTSGTNYQYSIDAQDNYGNISAQSSSINVSTQPNPTPPPAKTADLNHDNTVNVFDLSILLSNYATTNTIADIDKSGSVNVIDLSILLSNYGK